MKKKKEVLILVLMEVAHRERSGEIIMIPIASFNPCSNGSCSPRRKPRYYVVIWSKVLILVLMEVAHRGGLTDGDKGDVTGFNPCSNGSCSPRRNLILASITLFEVLILVLMEVAHRAKKALLSGTPPAVLILVLMEVAHRDQNGANQPSRYDSFNPCSNGSCSPSSSRGFRPP